MASELSASAQRVQEALADRGLPGRVVELSQTTRTAVEAARAIGCDVAQIVKSLVFCGAWSGQAYLVLVRGVDRVDESRLAEVVGEQVTRASPEVVRARTGYAIGGVPPVGHREPLPTLIDVALLEMAELWAAAGTPHAVFRVRPDELVRITGGRVVVVAAGR
uniref:YbaK/EbsC family protein n=1 Tax=Thermorudis peleae TaxID=1382356 RepID=A0A831X756_9BACT